MSAGKKIVVGLRGAGILLGVWGVLALVAWIAGVIPPWGAAEPNATAEDGAVDADVSADAGVLAVAPDPVEPTAPVAPQPLEPGPASEGPSATPVVDAGTPDAGNGAPRAPGRSDAIFSVRVAARDALVGETAALSAASLVGDDRVELLVALGSEIHVVGLHESVPLRVAHLGEPGAASPARPRVADVTGDGRPDLVVGYARLGDEGGPIGGTLQLVPGTTTGGLDEARMLAPIAATGLLVATDAGGARIAAVNWTDGFGRRASELWTFAGGASPTRRGRARLGNDGTDVVAADLDRDGDEELVALDASGITRVTMDGARLGVLDVARATHALASDLDRDGATDVVVVADGLHVVRGGVEPLEALPIDAPHGLRRLVAADVNGDERPDLVGVSRDGVVLLVQRDPFVFAQESLVHLPSFFRPFDLAVITLGARPVLVVLGLGATGWQLVALPLGSSVEVSATPPTELLDAPLVLRVPLR